MGNAIAYLVDDYTTTDRLKSQKKVQDKEEKHKGNLIWKILKGKDAYQVKIYKMKSWNLP